MSNNESPYIIPDPSHMVKLVRNLSGKRKIFYNEKNDKIDFYLEKLNELQEMKDYI
jgi:hypothetical protein